MSKKYGRRGVQLSDRVENVGKGELQAISLFPTISSKAVSC